METYKEREAIKKVYNYKSWHDKVDKMSDAQVKAIYLRLLSEKKL